MRSYGVLGDLYGGDEEFAVYSRRLAIFVEDRSYLDWMVGLETGGLRVQHVEASIIALLQLLAPLVGLFALPRLFLLAEGHET